MVIARTRRHLAGLVSGRASVLGLGGVTVLVCLPVLLLFSGCAPDPVEDYAPATGTSERVPGLEASRFAIVTDGSGAGTLVGTLLNTTQEPNALISAAVAAHLARVDAVLGDGDLKLPPGKTVPVARNNAVSLSTKDLSVGFFVELRLTFRNGPAVQMLVPVEPQRGPYAEIEFDHTTRQ